VALNIKDPETVRLAAEVAAITGETKTGAVRAALRERRERLALQGRAVAERERLAREAFDDEFWQRLPDDARAPTQAEQDEILGYGPEGF
jgi:antitoxin VapB